MVRGVGDKLVKRCVSSFIVWPRPSAEAIDAAVSSPVFWATARAVHELALEAEWVGRWCEGCPCHEGILLAWAYEQVDWACQRYFDIVHIYIYTYIYII